MDTNKFLKVHAVFSTLAILALIATHIAGPSANRTFDKINVRHIDVLDSEGRVRVQLAGEFSPRRKDLSGLLFHNQDGNEAGGLVYSGKKDENGEIQAGAILTFDQYGDDQIMAIQYSHSGNEKRNGMLIMDRPDELGENLANFYRAFSQAETDEEREKLKEELLPKVPPEEMPARRLFLGRTTRNSSTINLYDPLGRVRLKLEVDADGDPKIEFLDDQGESVKSISSEDVTAR
jgi:hypothetical protein